MFKVNNRTSFYILRDLPYNDRISFHRFFIERSSIQCSNLFWFYFLKSDVSNNLMLKYLDQKSLAKLIIKSIFDDKFYWSSKHIWWSNQLIYWSSNQHWWSNISFWFYHINSYWKNNVKTIVLHSAHLIWFYFQKYLIIKIKLIKSKLIIKLYTNFDD